MLLCYFLISFIYLLMMLGMLGCILVLSYCFFLLKVSLSKTKHKRRANTVEFSEKTPVSLCSSRPNPLTDVGGGRIARPWLQCFLGSYCFLNRKQPAQPSALHAIVFSIVQIFH